MTKRLKEQNIIYIFYVMSMSGYFGDDFQNLVTNLKQILWTFLLINVVGFFIKAKFI